MKPFLHSNQQRRCLRAQQYGRPAMWRFSRLLILPAMLVAVSPAWAGPGLGIGGRHGHFGYDNPPENNVQSDYWRQWADLKSSTDKLLKTVGSTNTEAALLLKQVQTNAQFLDAKWNAWFETHARPRTYSPADDYLSSLRADNWQLGAAKKEKDAARILALLRDVAFDLQIKADNCRNSGDGLGKEIAVKVHTKADGKEIGGYEVFYVTKGMLNVKSAHDRFPRQSSPTDEKILPPGGYALWARKKDFTGEPVFMGIGGHGETRLEVDLAVPAE